MFWGGGGVRGMDVGGGSYNYEVSFYWLRRKPVLLKVACGYLDEPGNFGAPCRNSGCLFFKLFLAGTPNFLHTGHLKSSKARYIP